MTINIGICLVIKVCIKARQRLLAILVLIPTAMVEDEHKFGHKLDIRLPLFHTPLEGILHRFYAERLRNSEVGLECCDCLIVQRLHIGGELLLF